MSVRFWQAILLGALAVFSAEGDALIVWPLDTTAVVLDSSVSALPFDVAVKRPPSPPTLVSREFFPRFGAAVAHAARRVDVIDSSAAPLSVLSPYAVRTATAGAASRNFYVPVSGGEDSARYSLVVGSLSLSMESRTVGRRFVPPEPPGFDPATGEMTPGMRHGYSVGPGIQTTLTASAVWILWDHEHEAAVAAGVSMGASTFRGKALPGDWNAAARALAKDVLRGTGFSPYH